VKAAGLSPLLVTGGHAEAVRAVAPGIPAVHATAHAEGLAESLKAGLAAAPANWRAALIILGDMPYVQVETLRRLADALAEGAAAVVPVQASRRGNPAGFARTAWPSLMALTGDQGARPILDSLGAIEIPVEDPGIHRDLDRPEDLGA
jgi:molybdenum cofactor cytidylyltransferase